MQPAPSTSRLADEQRQIRLNIGSEAGTRLASGHGTGTNPDILMHLMLPDSVRDVLARRILRVDDSTYRKDPEYGAILVDPVIHQVVYGGWMWRESGSKQGHKT